MPSGQLTTCLFLDFPSPGFATGSATELVDDSARRALSRLDSAFEIPGGCAAAASRSMALVVYGSNAQSARCAAIQVGTLPSSVIVASVIAGDKAIPVETRR